MATLAALERVAEEVASLPGHLDKQAVLRRYFSDLNSEPGKVFLAVKLLLPLKNIDQRVYNLRDARMVRLLSRLCDVDADDVQRVLDSSGDISATAAKFFAGVATAKKSTLTLAEADAFLESLNGLTTEDQQFARFEPISKRCTPADMKMLVRCINKDARIGAGSKLVLNAIHPDAAAAFASSSDLRGTVEMALKGSLPDSQPDGGEGTDEEAGGGGGAGGGAAAGTPQRATPQKKGKGLAFQVAPFACVKPMLAGPAKDLDELMEKRCREGAYVEIKYDGERLQVHKRGGEYKFYSRAGKPFDASKIAEVEQAVRTALASASSCIIDGEVLAYDTKLKHFLPFGATNKHKKKDYPNAVVCFVAFDILYLDGRSLLEETMRERRRLLAGAIRLSPPKVVLSEMTEVLKGEKQKLADLFLDSIQRNEEGLMFKPFESTYEPNKRHWWKLKKDYLEGMADTCDLVCLGAYFGKGSKGGMLSIFLMGAWDASDKTWKTVCKVGNGFDDATIDRLQRELKASGLLRPVSEVGVPAHISVSNSEKPDYIAPDPKKMPVWEVKGFEMTESKSHTAGLSVRFPRIERERPDKDYTTANDLAHLRNLMNTAKARSASASSLKGGKKAPAAKKDPPKKAAGGAKKASGATKKAAGGAKKGADAGRKRKKDDEEEDEEEEAASGDEDEEADAEGESTEEEEEEDAKAGAGPSKAGARPAPPPAGDWLSAVKLRGRGGAQRRRAGSDEEDEEGSDGEDGGAPSRPAKRPRAGPAAGPARGRGKAPAADEDEDDEEKTEDEEDGVPGPSGGASSSRPGPPPGMQACKYGAACYRKNPQHIRDFWHPPKAS
eukprot:tig00000789_g4113.t1